MTLALGALIALTVAGIASAGNTPVTVRAGNLELTFNGGFSPKTLPKSKLAPIALTAEGKIKTVDGTHPPALKEFLLETDKNGAVNVKGFPTCKAGQLQSQDTKHAEAICKSAIIGSGTTNVEIAFPEQAPIPVSSKLLVFNGGVKGGVTTFYIHAYITVPTPAAIVTTVKIKKIHNGRYGMLSTATIPKIAGGAGSVTSFSLKVDKKYTYKGKKASVLSAKCPDGKLQAHGTAIFSDGTRASAEILRTCTGKG
ncbi:MAG: hypothetical protein U0R26_05050 [Solirubrobacterales bacterium]